MDTLLDEQIVQLSAQISRTKELNMSPTGLGVSPRGGNAAFMHPVLRNMSMMSMRAEGVSPQF